MYMIKIGPEEAKILTQALYTSGTSRPIDVNVAIRVNETGSSNFVTFSKIKNQFVSSGVTLFNLYYLCRLFRGTCHCLSRGFNEDTVMENIHSCI